MSGLEVLEGILGSLKEADSFGVRTFREIVFSPGGSRVRSVFHTGTVLGVQEFGYPRVDSLIGEEIDTEASESTYGAPEKSVHLYKVMKMMRLEDSCARTVVFRDTTYSREKNGIFEAHPSFDSVCRDHDVRFTKGLKPSVEYSIVTPAVKIEFPACAGWRGSQMGFTRSTDGTAIVYRPFSIVMDSELSEILEFFNSGQTFQDGLYRIENSFEQATRVIRAVRENPDFEKLTGGYVQLSSKIDEKAREEHLAGIGELAF